MGKKRGQSKRSRIGRKLGFLLLLIILFGVLALIPNSIVPEKVRPWHQQLVDIRDHIVGKVKGPVKKSEYPNETTRAKETHDFLTICSFRINELGYTKNRDDGALAYILKDYDIVVIQGLTAPPFPMNFPDGRPVKPKEPATNFFNAMLTHGFEYELSPEDTGPSTRIHTNDPSTEWWVAFYNDRKVSMANDLPQGYLAGDRSNHASYDRVPYAFAFRSVGDQLDFVIISVFLRDGGSNRDVKRRKDELASVVRWINTHNKVEKDFVILGTMNISNAQELKDVIPFGFVSLNEKCRSTVTDISSSKPYDHVLFNPIQVHEIDNHFDLKVLDLARALEGMWREDDPFPGAPYDHKRFKQHYSDHHPILFRLIIPNKDDD